VFAYSYGPDDGTPMRRRLVAAFDHFVEVGHLSSEWRGRRSRRTGSRGGSAGPAAAPEAAPARRPPASAARLEQTGARVAPFVRLAASAPPGELRRSGRVWAAGEPLAVVMLEQRDRQQRGGVVEEVVGQVAEADPPARRRQRRTAR
jgi:hypothetical protein